uniref:Uncharacterized LOC100183096 n=2 Tax=Ciona intestinalis TaxID=7719 RepID=H2Y3C9_CIOIN
PDVLYEEFSGKVSKKPKAEEKVDKPKKQEEGKKTSKAKRSRTRKRKSSTPTPTKTPTPSPTAHEEEKAIEAVCPKQKNHEPMKDDSATQHTPPCDDAYRNNMIPNQQRALLPNGGAGDAPQPQEQSLFANNLETANPFFYTPHSFN